MKAIEGKRGDRPDLVRTYVLLAKALAEPDETKRHRELGDLERNLRTRILAVREAREARAKEPRPERPVRSALIDPNDPLAPLLGGTIPADAKARTEAIEAAAEKVDLDDLASAALDHHVRAEGEQSVAPWLIGVVVPLYLAECVALGLRDVRIVHGKGTGTLRTTVHALLQRSSLVHSYRLGDEHAGSWGATVVTLRR